MLKDPGTEALIDELDDTEGDKEQVTKLLGLLLVEIVGPFVLETILVTFVELVNESLSDDAPEKLKDKEGEPEVVSVVDAELLAELLELSLTEAVGPCVSETVLVTVVELVNEIHSDNVPNKLEDREGELENVTVADT